MMTATYHASCCVCTSHLRRHVARSRSRSMHASCWGHIARCFGPSCSSSCGVGMHGCLLLVFSFAPGAYQMLLVVGGLAPWPGVACGCLVYRSLYSFIVLVPVKSSQAPPTPVPGAEWRLALHGKGAVASKCTHTPVHCTKGAHARAASWRGSTCSHCTNSLTPGLVACRLIVAVSHLLACLDRV